jgi:hypothetical protein
MTELREYWHFTTATDFNMLLHNAAIGKGLITTVSEIAKISGLEEAVTMTDVRPALGEFEPVLEAIRTSDYSDKPSRRGAFFVFEDRATCEHYSRAWTNNAPLHILKCILLPGSRIHRGHLAWMNNPPRDQWPEIARAYWAGEEGRAPHHWEILVNGQLFFADWQKPPFPQFGSSPTSTPPKTS